MFWSGRKSVFDEMKRRSQVAASCLGSVLKHEPECMKRHRDEPSPADGKQWNNVSVHVRAACMSDLLMFSPALSPQTC